MPLDAGQLRHYIDIERLRNIQDETSGAVVQKWIREFEAVPVDIQPITSLKEAYQAAAIQAELTTKVTMRLVAGLNARQRFVHGRYCCSELGVEILNPGQPLRDKNTGLEYVTFSCSQGVNEG